MATIVVKDADFSGAPIAGYVPPVPGAMLAAWVGDADAAVALRNFGSGADLMVAAGMPQDAGGGFRTFSNINHLKSDAYYRPATTLMAVMRRSGNTDWQAALSSERNAADGGAGARRGLTLRSQSSAKMVSIAASGNSGVTRVSQLGVADVHRSRCLIGTVQASGAGSAVEIHDLTEGRSGQAQSGTDASTRPMPDEASNPFLIGANYVGTAVAMDIAFVGVWPFVLTAAQRTLMYQSVKKRMAALGSAI